MFGKMGRKSNQTLVDRAIDRSTDLLQQKRYQKALICCDEGLDIVPNTMELLIKTECHKNLGEYDKALKYAEQTLKYSDTDSRSNCLFLKAQILLALDRDQDTLDAVSEAMKSGSYDPNIHFLKGFVLHRIYTKLQKKEKPEDKDKLKNEERLKEILDCYDNAVEHEPTSLRLSSKGRILYNLKKYDQAIKCFEQALSMITDNDPIPDELIQVYMADALHAIQRHDDAVNYCRQAIKKGSKEPDLLYMLGRSLYNLDLLDEALDSINTVIKIGGPSDVYDELRKDIISKIETKQEIEK